MVSNIAFESIITSIRKNLFNQRMMNFLDKVELRDKRYQTTGNVRGVNYKYKFLFTLKDFF